MSRVRRAGVAVGLAALTIALSIAPDLAAGAQEQRPVTPDALEPPVATISPDLIDVAVDSSGFRDLQDAFTDARDRRVRAERDLVTLDAAEQRLVGRVDRAARVRHRTGKRLAYIRAAIQQIAVEDYTQGQVDDGHLTAHDPAAANVAGERQVLVDSVSDAHLEDEAVAEEEHAGSVREHELSRALLADVRQRLVDTEAARDAAASEEAELRPEVERARVLAPVIGVDFPLIALDAYHKAARTLAAEEPSCGVRWWALAGISRVEGRHGTFGGASIEPTGDLTRPIIGIPLPAIGETDGGLLDGDPTVDHAVGPMQFIPSTWASHGRDGNGDGRADPQNMYDATASAAAYLCHSGPGLDGDAGLRRAFFSYNHSHSYVEQVLSHARHYQLVLRDLP